MNLRFSKLDVYQLAFLYRFTGLTNTGHNEKRLRKMNFMAKRILKNVSE